MKRQKILLFGGWFTLLALSILWRLLNFDTFGANNDEGAYLMWARLVAEGYPLYSQTYSVSAPLFIEMLALVFKLFGFGVVLGRAVILLSFVLTTGVLAWLSHRIAGWIGAYVSLVILTIMPNFFILSRDVMAEVPATLFAILAVTFTYIYFERKERRWLILSGSVLAISLMMKALYPAAGVPIAYFILRNEKSWRERIIDASLFGFAALVTLVVIVSPYPWADFFDQAVKFRADLRTTIPLNIAGNYKYILEKMADIAGIWILAGLGMLVSVKKIRTQAWLLWIATSFLLLLWQTPLFGHHTIILVPGLILLIVDFSEYLWQSFQQNTLAKPHNIALMIAAIGSLFYILPIFNLIQKDLYDTGISGEIGAIQVLEKVTRPTDFVISDSQKVPLFANRVTPPPMGDIANVAIFSGRQTSERLIQISNTYHIQALIPWTDRLTYLPAYLDWAEQNFFVHKKWDDWHQLYFGRKLIEGEAIPHDQSTQFGDSIMLRGYSIDAETISTGETLPITLYWQGTQAVEISYTIFSQVLNADGMLVAQMDSLPIYGYYPTNQWAPDEIVPNRMDIPLPANLPAGTYSIIVGMYDLNTMKRLTQTNGENFIQLGTVVLE